MRIRVSAAVLASLLLVPLIPASAQGGDLDQNDLALIWSLGEYRAPLVCEIDGTPHRGLRRVRISPGPRGSVRRSNRVQIYDLEVPRGTRCFTETGRTEPNAIGALYFDLEGRSKPDTASRDFQTRLRREGGVEFKVRRGRLRLGPAAEAPGKLEEVDFEGGSVRLQQVKRGSDSYRRLADIQGERKLTLTLTAPGREPVTFDLVQIGRP